MNAVEVIEEIKRLPEGEREKVVEFVRHLPNAETIEAINNEPQKNFDHVRGACPIAVIVTAGKVRNIETLEAQGNAVVTGSTANCVSFPPTTLDLPADNFLSLLFLGSMSSARWKRALLWSEVTPR